MRSISLAKARATIDSGQVSRVGRRHSRLASLVSAASAMASRRVRTSEPLSSRMACIACSSGTPAARAFSATASKAGGSASSGKWRQGRDFDPLVPLRAIVERGQSLHERLFRKLKPGKYILDAPGSKQHGLTHGLAVQSRVRLHERTDTLTRRQLVED